MADQISKRTKRTDGQWLEILQKLCKSNGYFLRQDLKPYSASYRKHATEELANRFVREGLAFPGKFKPQRYYLTAGEAVHAIATKPPRRRPNFSKLPKCEVMHAPPSSAILRGQHYDFEYGMRKKEHLLTRRNFTNDDNQLVTVVTAADMLTGAKNHLRHRNYGMLGLRAFDAGYARLPLLYATLDAMPTISPTVHNLSFTFQAPRLDASLFKNIPDHNHARRGKINVNGIPVSYEVYSSGKVNVKARLTYTPIDPRDISQLQNSIRSYLPLGTPTTDKWLITTSDVAFDIPTTRRIRGFKLSEFEYQGRMMHAYAKKLYGKWYLRFECHEYPHVTISGYMTFIERAALRLSEAAGK